MGRRVHLVWFPRFLFCQGLLRFPLRWLFAFFNYFRCKLEKGGGGVWEGSLSSELFGSHKRKEK